MTANRLYLRTMDASSRLMAQSCAVREQSVLLDLGLAERKKVRVVSIRLDLVRRIALT